MIDENSGNLVFGFIQIEADAVYTFIYKLYKVDHKIGIDSLGQNKSIYMLL